MRPVSLKVSTLPRVVTSVAVPAVVPRYTSYAVTAAPPSSAGAVQVSVTEPLPGVADRVGADGGSAGGGGSGTVALTSFDRAPTPATFTAATS